MGDGEESRWHRIYSGGNELWVEQKFPKIMAKIKSLGVKYDNF